MSNETNISDWRVEDESFWNTRGKSIASTNLWVSIPNLLCGFAVWLFWSIITVQMLNVGFPFQKSELFSLMAIAGLTGATLRIPSTFFIRPCGGRNTIFFTSALLILPAIGVGFALQDQNTPLWVFQILALLSGFGGGNFSSSMSNISFFYPKRVQGYALGMNAGLGNFGVTTMQILVPLVMTFGLFGGNSMELIKPSGSLIGKIAAGEMSYIHNAGFIWVPILIITSVLAFFKMNNIKTENVSPNVESTLGAVLKMSWLLILGFVAAVIGLTLLMKVGVSKWIVLPIVVFLTVNLMKFLSPKPLRESLIRQYKIFGSKHNWIMTIIYTMTFGSFIGFAAAFPLSIKVIFGFKHMAVAGGGFDHSMINPNGPSALSYAWLGPFIGALIRPVGGKIADKVGGAFVTQICAIAMVVCSLGVAYYMHAAYTSATPEQYFMPFFLLFLALFTATGIGNGSTFRTIAVIFEEEQRGPVLGWTAAIAAYGAFIIPKVFGEQIKATTPENALYGFAVFYGLCAVLNWWYYLGPKADYKNP
ncbi:MAG: MFS transporter [Halobacteriovoraceae bacterium]|jgi:MFS transporter, NNP family, nitrate/nitrite transporter|nr:MFS transporter [Halobacteriovoraceae bacterium]